MARHINIVKLPPEYLPALSQEMTREQPTVTAATSGAVEPVKSAFLEALGATQELAEVAYALDKNLRPLNRDHDDAGYCLSEVLEDIIRRLSSPRVIALSSEEAVCLADAQALRAELFPPEGAEAIFQLSYLEEWNAVERLLDRAGKGENPGRLSRLGLAVILGRLRRLHLMMGEAIGVQSEVATPLKSSVAAFEKSMAQLVAMTYAFYGQETVEHRQWRLTLLGSYDRQVDAYHEAERRKRQSAAEKKAAKAAKEKAAKEKAEQEKAAKTTGE